MAEWRANESKMHPVSLTINGVEHTLTVAQAMELVRSAPKMLSGWQALGTHGACRRAVDGRIVAEAFDSGDWTVGRGYAREFGTDPLDAAKSAADAALRAAGFILGDGDA